MKLEHEWSLKFLQKAEHDLGVARLQAKLQENR